MKLTKREREKFNEWFQKLFILLDFDANSLELNGSYAYKLESLYSGDIDMREAIDEDDFDKWYDTTYQEVKDELKNRVFEVKIGKTKHKSFVNKNTILKDLENAPDNKQKIKIDFYYILNGYATEFSIIYDFGKPLSIEQVLNDLYEDIKDYYDDGNYFKMFRRIMTVFRLKGVKGDEKKAIDEIILDPLYGNMYLIISRLKTLLHFSKQKKKPFLQLIKEDLRKIGLSHLYKDNVEAMVKVLQSYLNKIIYNKFVKGKKITQLKN